MDYNLCDINTVKSILSRHGFNFSKALGQNFLINEEVCPEMARLLEADGDTGVIEIGPGVGVLTKELCKTAKRVVAIELDKRLYPVLEETLGDYGNFELVEGDALELDLNSIIAEKLSDCKSIKVCANLPYYITSPVIIKLLSEVKGLDEIEVMVQREAAQRLCAELGTRQTGAVSVAVRYYGEAQVLFDVGRNSFMPSPKVDSAVIKITIHKEPKYDINDEKEFFRFVKGAFMQRRKTLLNSLSSSLGIEKKTVLNALIEEHIAINIRAENLKMEDFVNLYNKLYN
ncbi:MAG: 16S rRNA (adenine(1518)-N(6)/adenine(1519)-N(6))-dimethyltransferase RsmA [Eubacterium sp.]|nr:16S rRNA (adenine(1518)-N(6)/adenine(1519)-N(6))-dimethyltransferase RsmA [Eubacterium sp.]